MGDEAHVVGVNDSEGSETVAHDCEEGDENVVDYVDNVVLFASHIDPAWDKFD